MKIVKGDLIALAKAGAFDCIVHGCNCFCTMGRGVAKSVKEHFPAAYIADKATGSGDRGKLGTLSQARIRLGARELAVVNAYTQFDWRGFGVKVDYTAMEQAFRRVKQEFAGMRIGYPMIGAGLAGGDWSIIRSIIDRELEGEDHTLVVFEG